MSLWSRLSAVPVSDTPLAILHLVRQDWLAYEQLFSSQGSSISATL